MNSITRPFIDIQGVQSTFTGAAHQQYFVVYSEQVWILF